jgi:hypothetical protein
MAEETLSEHAKSLQSGMAADSVSRQVITLGMPKLRNAQPPVVIRATEPPRRKISECIANDARGFRCHHRS